MNKRDELFHNICNALDKESTLSDTNHLRRIQSYQKRHIDKTTRKRITLIYEKGVYVLKPKKIAELCNNNDVDTCNLNVKCGVPGDLLYDLCYCI